MSEFIDPVFMKASRKRSFSITENEHFGLVFTKTGSIISGTGQLSQADLSMVCKRLIPPRSTQVGGGGVYGMGTQISVRNSKELLWPDRIPTGFK